MLTIKEEPEGSDFYVLVEDGRCADAGGSCVEGSSDEWMAIAKAMATPGSTGVSFKRCAVRRRERSWIFYSPRNSDARELCPEVWDDEAPAFIAAVFNMFQIDGAGI